MMRKTSAAAAARRMMSRSPVATTATRSATGSDCPWKDSTRAAGAHVGPGDQPPEKNLIRKFLSAAMWTFSWCSQWCISANA